MESVEIIREYTRRRQATIAGKVACSSIYDICFEEEQMPVRIRMVRG